MSSKSIFKCLQILVFNPFCDGDIFVAEDRSESENGPGGHHQDCGGSHPHSLRNFTPQILRILAWPSREKKENLVLFFNISIIFLVLYKYKKGPLGNGTSCIHENI
jgi:hypothetical protein